MSFVKFQKGNLLHIVNYQFQDGNGSKNKFLIVLTRNDEDAYIIHTLTTSQNSKLFKGQNFGCSVESNIPYFFIPADTDLKGEKNYKFKKDTFIFFQNNIRKENLSSFLKYCEDNDIEFKEKLPDLLLKRLLKCLLKSQFISLNMIEELTEIKNSL